MVVFAIVMIVKTGNKMRVTYYVTSDDDNDSENNMVKCVVILQNVIHCVTKYSL